VSARADVDLWWADLDAAPAAGRDGDPPALRRRLARRAILREVLSRYLDCRPDEIVLSRTGAGRPELDWPRSDLRFSVASSGATALFAVTREGAIGVDVERARHSAGLNRTAHLFLTPDEGRMVAGVEPDRRDAALLRLWTLKEALAKAMGTGLSIEPAELELRPPWRRAVVATSGDVVAALARESAWGTCRQRRYAASPSAAA
jgi:phosphopantetheinyl transferase